MNDLLLGLLGVLLATNQFSAATSVVTRATGLNVNVPDPNDPVEREYQKLLADDDAAEEEVDRLIRDAHAFAEKGAGDSELTLKFRVEQRLKPVRDAYEDFLRRHPGHVRARLAYGSFLDDLGEDDAAREQWEKACETDPRNAAAWNNLANYHGHNGPVKKAFEYYARAIELKPDEPLYLRNLATTVYLFRVDAREFYGIDEQQVFDKAIGLYRRALQLDPRNFELAADLAQTYYGIKPARVDDALTAWHDALNLASTEEERQGVYIHLARIELNSGRFAEARRHLALVTLDKYAELKKRLLRNLTEKEDKAKENLGPDA